MPDIVTHNAMGDKVLCQLPVRIVAEIDYSFFRFSVMGPDPFIFYRFITPHLRHGVNKRSHTMHRTKTADFLVELVRHSRSREMFSFLSGFLCHFAMDSVSHPFIYGLAEYQGPMHTAIEHRLDVMELERQGRQRRDLMKLFTAFPKLPEVKQAMKAVYGWDDDCYEIGYRYMKLFHWLVKDQHGLMNLVFRNFGNKPASLSYRNHLADNLDLSPFEALEKQAVDFGTELITAAYQYRNGDLDEEGFRRIIGDRNYAGERYES